MRELAIQAAFRSSEARLCGMSLDEFRAALESADVEPVIVCGELAGAVIVMGCEIHACVLPEFKGRWMNRKALALLSRIIRQYGKAITSATTEEGREFVRRLGFVREGDVYVKR